MHSVEYAAGRMYDPPPVRFYSISCCPLMRDLGRWCQHVPEVSQATPRIEPVHLKLRSLVMQIFDIQSADATFQGCEFVGEQQ